MGYLRERNKDLTIHRNEIRENHWKRNMSEESIRLQQERDKLKEKSRNKQLLF